LAQELEKAKLRVLQSVREHEVQQFRDLWEPFFQEKKAAADDDVKMLESLWARDEDHVFAQRDPKNANEWHPSEYAKTPTPQEPWEPLSWVKKHQFTPISGRPVQVTHETDAWKFTKDLEREVRSRLGR